ncbi:hypothetical protein KPATCC21470_5387 [Kitasatospora purpeofusca]
MRFVVGGEAGDARLGRYGRARRREAGTVQITHGHSPVPFREHRDRRSRFVSMVVPPGGGGTGSRPSGPVVPGGRPMSGTAAALPRRT